MDACRAFRNSRQLARTLFIAAALAAAAAIAMPSAARAEDATGPAAAAPGAAASTPSPVRRPRIGVVLSGGGARGLTHIGVLKVLEEMRVPIDYITATSMGSIVGGLYATGVSASEMERLVTSLDWPAFFSDQPPRRELSVRRKREDALYTIPLELGFRDFSFRLATGALTGQNLELLLHTLTWREDDIGSFDNLPIPFRAVATNLVDGSEVVFDHGPLYIAMRGSMSVPGIFAPLDLDGRMLGDGGLVKNLPVDIIKSMGAEVVIAINIGTPLMTREQLSSFFGVAEQSINILTEQNVRAQRALLVPPRDVLIEPDLDDLSAADFNKGARFIALGEKAARASADALSRYALSADDYAAYRLALRRPAGPAASELEFAGIRGTEITNPEVLQAQVDLEAGREDRFSDRADRHRHAVRTRRLRPHRLRAHRSAGTARRSVRRCRKAVGPRLSGVRPGLFVGHAGGEHVRAQDPVQADVAQFARRRMDQRHRGRLDELPALRALSAAQSGADACSSPPTRASGRRPRTSSCRASRSPSTACSTSASASISDTHSAAGATCGSGPQYVHERGDPAVASPLFPVTRLDEWGFALLGHIDTQDNAFFPRHGLRLTFAGFTGTQRQRDVDQKVSRAELDVHQSIPIGDQDAINVGLRLAGTDVFNPVLVGNFRLGGFLEVSGLRYRELEGSYLGRARAVYLHRMGTLPVFGNTYYFGGSLEAGNVWQQRSAISFGDTIKAGSVFFAADTPFGPFYIAWGHTNRGDSTWYLLLGRP